MKGQKGVYAFTKAQFRQWIMGLEPDVIVGHSRFSTKGGEGSGELIAMGHVLQRFVRDVMGGDLDDWAVRDWGRVNKRKVVSPMGQRFLPTIIVKTVDGTELPVQPWVRRFARLVATLELPLYLGVDARTASWVLRNC